jgi:hypothetical protein
MNTPEIITELPEDSIFVFGSNELGFHMGGAARVANEKFGAVWGEGEGLFGQSYALPTMSGFEDLKAAVGRFLYFASTRRDLTFYVTKIGTGIAGHKIEDIAPLFRDCPPNVVLPIEFDS